MLYLFACAAVAKQIYCVWQTTSVLIVKLQSSLFDAFCPSRLSPVHSFVYFLSHSFMSPLFSSTPSNSPQPLCPVTLYLSLFSLSLSFSVSSFSSLSLSFNSIRGQGPTPLPLHPHLLSVFFSRWCNSAVRCRGHHKLTRNLITVDLMSGKERGRERGAARETLRKTETESSSSYLPGDMEDWMRGGTNSSSGRRHHHHHHKRWSEERSKSEQQRERERKGAMPGYDIIGVVLNVLFQMETVS